MDQSQHGPMQTMSQQDLERMLNQLENMMRHGSRETAQEMLSQLRDLLDRLQRGQQGQMGQMQRGQGQQMMQMLDQMGNIIGIEQQLQDDTFGAQRDGQQGQQGQQQGQHRASSGQQGQQGQGQDGQGQQQGQGQQGQGQGRGPGELGQRQGQLRDRSRPAARRPAPFRPAGAGAVQRRRRGDGQRAARARARRPRYGARASRAVRSSSCARARADGRADDAPDGAGNRSGRVRTATCRAIRWAGRSDRKVPISAPPCKVPDEIDVQRAREILEELRRRLGEQPRPTIELDYIERLLRRF